MITEQFKLLAGPAGVPDTKRTGGGFSKRQGEKGGLKVREEFRNFPLPDEA